MKKTVLIIGLALWSSLLWAQEIPDCDYNPYRYKERCKGAKEAYEQVYQEFVSEPCNIDYFYEMVNEYNRTHNIDYLWTINGNCNCPEVVNYAKSLIDSSQSEEIRCLAIGMIGFRRQTNDIPYLLQHLEKTTTITEKIAIATTLVKLGERTKSKEIFEQYCYEMESIDMRCISYYLTLNEEQAAIRYFDYFFNKPQCQLHAACWLASLGIYDKTFPLFVEFLQQNTVYERETTYSLTGLAAIGTPEAFEIIKQQTKNNTDALTARTAILTLERIIRERRKKCGE